MLPLLTSCATIIRGGSESVYVVVANPGIRDSALHLSTLDGEPLKLRQTEIPEEFTTVLPRNTKAVVAERNGTRAYIPTSRSINPTIFLNFLLYTFPIIVDDYSGAAFKYDDVYVRFDSTHNEASSLAFIANPEDPFSERPKLMFIGSFGLPLYSWNIYTPHGGGGVGLSYLKKIESMFTWSTLGQIEVERSGISSRANVDNARTFATRVYPIPDFFLEVGYTWMDLHVRSTYDGNVVYPGFRSDQRAFVPAIGWSGDFSYVSVKRWMMSPISNTFDDHRALDMMAVEFGLNIRL
jgi:hypothetical protein